LLNVVLLIGGLGLLVFGSRLFVDSAVVIAQNFGVSEFVIGLTIVAAGTSLPEVAPSIMAAIRGERDIAVGNVVGSNIFNIMGVLGITSLVSPEGIAVSEAAFRLDLPVMIAVAVACLPIFFTGHLIARWEGALFMAYYCAYTASIIIAATVPALSRTFATVMLGVVLPLTVITLITVVVRHLRTGNPPGDEPETRPE
jgi:cation:H+ antiporter